MLVEYPNDIRNICLSHDEQYLIVLFDGAVLIYEFEQFLSQVR